MGFCFPGAGTVSVAHAAQVGLPARLLVRSMYGYTIVLLGPPLVQEDRYLGSQMVEVRHVRQMSWRCCAGREQGGV